MGFEVRHTRSGPPQGLQPYPAAPSVPLPPFRMAPHLQSQNVQTPMLSFKKEREKPGAARALSQWQSIPFHEPRSRGRQSAPSSTEGNQRRLTSAATVQGFKARNFVWGNSLPVRDGGGGDTHHRLVLRAVAEKDVVGEFRVAHGHVLSQDLQDLQDLFRPRQVKWVS